MEKRFRRFLKKHGITDFDDREKGIGLIYDRRDPSTWITGRIYFDDQPEGWEFWYKIAKEWREEIKNGKEFPETKRVS